MLSHLGAALPSLVKAKYDAAKASSELIYSPTELSIIRTSSGVPFQLRYCPSLMKKPLPRLDSLATKTLKKPDPFENPPSDLLIAEIPRRSPTHTIVLNKFPIIEQHFILATKSFKEQTDPLEQDDLMATYSCIKAWNSSASNDLERRLYAFFNSGDHSGASQPHRHIQFLPVECMRDGQGSYEWDVLMDSILLPEDEANVTPRHVPFTYFSERFPEDPSAQVLHEIYMRLHQTSMKAMDDYIRQNSNDDKIDNEGSASAQSYNMGMTASGMVICPRLAEGRAVLNKAGGDAGFVALNGTMLAGTLMVKKEEERTYMTSDNTILDKILQDVGVPSNAVGPTPGTVKI